MIFSNNYSISVGIVPDNIIDGLRGQKLHPPVVGSDQSNALIRQRSSLTPTPNTPPTPKKNVAEITGKLSTSGSQKNSIPDGRRRGRVQKGGREGRVQKDL